MSRESSRNYSTDYLYLEPSHRAVALEHTHDLVSLVWVPGQRDGSNLGYGSMSQWQVEESDQRQRIRDVASRTVLLKAMKDSGSFVRT